MNERTRKLIVFAVALIVVVWGYFNLFGSKQEKAGPPDAPAIPANLRAVKPDSSKAEMLRISDQLADEYEAKGWGKDPFYHTYANRSRRAKVINEIRPKLLGILYREISPQALINNRVVEVGDTVGGYRVIEINLDFVKVANRSKTIKLWFSKESS